MSGGVLSLQPTGLNQGVKEERNISKMASVWSQCVRRTRTAYQNCLEAAELSECHSYVDKHYGVADDHGDHLSFRLSLQLVFDRPLCRKCHRHELWHLRLCPVFHEFHEPVIIHWN